VDIVRRDPPGDPAHTHPGRGHRAAGADGRRPHRQRRGGGGPGALNNADRHARADSIVIDILATTVTVTDDGVGFDPLQTTLGTALAESFMGRMRRANGTASVRSTPGAGTVVTVNWPQLQRTTPDVPDEDGVDQADREILFRFGIGIVVFALLQLAVGVPFAAMHTDRPGAQYVIGALAALVALGGIRGVLRPRAESHGASPDPDGRRGLSAGPAADRRSARRSGPVDPAGHHVCILRICCGCRCRRRSR
jgi:hypothetical protein